MLISTDDFTKRFITVSAVSLSDYRTLGPWKTVISTLTRSEDIIIGSMSGGFARLRMVVPRDFTTESANRKQLEEGRC